MTTTSGVRRVALIIACIVAIGLAGCGSDDPPPTSRPTVTKDGVTVAGTHLALGQTATLPGPRSGSYIKLTVTDIEQGTSADLERAGVAHADRKTPYFVHYELKSVGGDVYGMAMHDYLSAWAGSTQVGDLVVFDAFPPCQEKNFPINPAPGTTLDSCKTYVADKGAPEVDSVRFDNDADYDMGEGTAITWK